MIHPVIVLPCALILSMELLAASAEQDMMEMELVVVRVSILLKCTFNNYIITTVSPIIIYGTLGATSFLLLIAIVITVAVICLRRCYTRRSSDDVEAKVNL